MRDAASVPLYADAGGMPPVPRSGPRRCGPRPHHVALAFSLAVGVILGLAGTAAGAAGGTGSVDVTGTAGPDDGAGAAPTSSAAGAAGGTGRASEVEPWRFPLRGQPAVVRGFDPPSQPWERGHRGVDLAARPGEPVFAAGAGRVLFAGMLAGRGVISIVHGTVRTTYEPVVPAVRAGQPVAAGDRIGVLGQVHGHCFPRACLHWGLLRGERYLNPLRLVGRGPVRLLPVWGVPRAVSALPTEIAARSQFERRPRNTRGH